MKVYGHRFSTATTLVLAMLEEKGHAAELVIVSLPNGEHKQPEHLSRHPFGVIPVFEDDDGFMLYESLAIARYLNDRLSGPSLIPTDLKQRARMEQWIGVEQSYFSGAVMRIFYPQYMGRMRGQEPDPHAIEAARAEVGKALGVLSAQLGTTPYLAGDAFSLADLCFLPYLELLAMVGSDDLIKQNAHTADWWKRLRSRPAWQKLASQIPSH